MFFKKIILFLFTFTYAAYAGCLEIKQPELNLESSLTYINISLTGPEFIELIRSDFTDIDKLNLLTKEIKDENDKPQFISDTKFKLYCFLSEEIKTACIQGNISKVKDIVKLNFLNLNENIGSPDYYAPLIHHAARSLNPELISFLIQSGSDINIKDKEDESLLINFIKFRKLYIKQLKQSSSLDKPCYMTLNLKQNSEKEKNPEEIYTMLRESIEIIDNNLLKCIKLLLDNNKTSTLDSDCTKAFHLAIDHNLLDIVQMMISYNVPWEHIEYKDKNEILLRLEKEDTQSQVLNNISTMLQLCVTNFEEAFKTIVPKLDIYVNCASLAKYLFEIVKEGSQVKGNMSKVKKLKDFIPLNLVDENNDTLLDIAIKNQDKAMLITLLGQNKQSIEAISKKNWQGQTAIDRVKQNCIGNLNMLVFIINLI